MKWRALVLGGGGPVGEFQIGAIQVIAEYYDSFDMYIGVGCGSLNSAALAQYSSLKEGSQILTGIWDGIKRTKDIFTVPFVGGELAALASLVSDKGWARDSIYGSQQLTAQIKKNINWDIIRNFTNWATEITSLNDGQRYTVTNNKDLLNGDNNPQRTIQFSLDPANEKYIGAKIYELLTAGGCTPLMLPPMDIFGHRFAEGGIRNCTPFPLAVKAYEIAMTKGYDEAEFIVIGNYVNEPNFETYDDLDSGMEIIGRTIKMMTIEIAQNEIFAGKTRLTQIGAKSSVIVIQPTVDFRLSPFNFNDLETRMRIRNHGVDRASLLIPKPAPSKMVSSAAQTIDSMGLDELITQFSNQPENTDIADKLVELTLSGDSLQLGMLNQLKPATAALSRMEGNYPCNDSKCPANLKELSDTMIMAASNGQKIKAVGGGFAFDDILDTPGVHIRMDKMNNIFKPNGDILKDPSTQNDLLEFETGATIDQLTNYLWAQGRALLNQPGYEGLSFMGVASCGGHGSGIRIGPIADAICAIHLLTFNDQGNLIHKRIEYSNGITDPVKFNVQFPDIQLIQDDDYFKAIKVCVGTFGVIYSVVVKTQPSFYLEETRIMQKWSDLKQTLPGKLSDSSIHSIHIWFNPYFLKGEINCVLSEYRIVPNRANQGHRGLGVTFGLVPELAPLILWCMEHFPNNLAVIMNSTLKATVNKYPYVMPCPEALNFGTPNLVSVDATNCGVPADRTIEVAESLFQLAGSRYSQGKYITSPIGFRFVNATDAFLAPQFEKPTCMIEMPLIKPTPFAQETIDAFLQHLIENFEGRPHWGQRLNQNVTPDKLKTMYPQLDKFKAKFIEFNWRGIFENEFTQKIGLNG